MEEWEGSIEKSVEVSTTGRKFVQMNKAGYIGGCATRLKWRILAGGIKTENKHSFVEKIYF